jgi:hypothetical protein
MDYFIVSIAGSLAEYEEISGVGSRFTDALGNTIQVDAPIAYNLRSWCGNRLAWMEPLPVQEAAPLIISKLEFLQLFTPQERILIRGVARTHPEVDDWLELLNAANEVNLMHITTINSVNGLESSGLIVTGRASSILSNTPC